MGGHRKRRFEGGKCNRARLLGQSKLKNRDPAPVGWEKSQLKEKKSIPFYQTACYNMSGQLIGLIDKILVNDLPRFRFLIYSVQESHFLRCEKNQSQ